MGHKLDDKGVLCK